MSRFYASCLTDYRSPVHTNLLLTGVILLMRIISSKRVGKDTLAVTV